MGNGKYLTRCTLFLTLHDYPDRVHCIGAGQEGAKKHLPAMVNTIVIEKYHAHSRSASRHENGQQT